MSFYCDVCDKTTTLKSKNKHIESNVQKEFDICKHLKLPIENPNISDVDETFYAYIIEHIKKYNYYLMKCEFK